MRLLGVIPRTAFFPERVGDPLDEEAFQMLRASLSYFSIDRPLKSIAIISPLVGDGKTTVAAGLALASARAGKRVILIDADLRRPQISVRLGIQAEAGLGEVLSGQHTLEDVLIRPDLGLAEAGELVVLPGGPPPPNPSALISSGRMRELVTRLEGEYDLVIIDTAAALAVSDSIPLVQTASGIAVIVRMNRSSSAAVRRLQKVIAEAEGNPMGVVATGQATPTGRYGRYYSYRYSYGENGHEPRRRFRIPFRRRRDEPYPVVAASKNGGKNGGGGVSPDPDLVRTASETGPTGVVEGSHSGGEGETPSTDR
jgi:capsular exopolysaccharide synthesis family protein